MTSANSTPQQSGFGFGQNQSPYQNNLNMLSSFPLQSTILAN